MIDQLQEQIQVVAEVRCKAQTLREMVSELRTEWEKYNAQTLDNLTQAGADVAVEEQKLRELTLQAYAETGDKAPAEGVGIRERTVLTYDGKVAFDWAKSHKMALQLDKRAFEKIAKADPPDFVKITTEPQATIATNLDDKTKG